MCLNFSLQLLLLQCLSSRRGVLRQQYAHSSPGHTYGTGPRGAVIQVIAPVQQAVQQKLEHTAADDPVANVLEEKQVFLNLQQAQHSLKPSCRLPIKP